jgi:hypothetical protein
VRVPGSPGTTLQNLVTRGKVLPTSTEAAGSRFENTNQDVDALEYELIMLLLEIASSFHLMYGVWRYSA